MNISRRNAQLDVLRCMAMFLIVLGHTYQHGTFYHTSKWLDLVFWTLICWHVDAFLALSGWFGVQFSLKKFARLYGVVLFYNVLSYLVGRSCLGMSEPFRITGGWYGNTYMCLMLVVPLLNEGVNGLVAKGVRTAWLSWCGFAIVMWVKWLSGNSYIGLVAYDIGPFSLVQMVFVYFTVRLVRLTDIAGKVLLWHLLAAIAGFVIIASVMPASRTNYIAPYTIAMAVSMLLLLEKFANVPSWLGKACLWAAPCMFGVYLCHEITSFGKLFHRVPIRFMIENCALPRWVAILFGAVACFLVSLAIEYTRRLAVRTLSNAFAKSRLRVFGLDV